MYKLIKIPFRQAFTMESRILRLLINLKLYLSNMFNHILKYKNMKAQKIAYSFS